MLARHGARAQAMVEFALALPIFLLLVYGLIEASRWIFMIQAVTTASREAARYASAAGINDAGNLYYQDCAGIRNAARSVASIVNLPDSNITITYDHGPGTGTTFTCLQSPAVQTNIMPASGDRVNVTVNATYSPTVPLLPFGRNIPIQAISSRTITGTIDLGTP